MRQFLIYIFKITYYFSLAYFTYLMILITLQYIPIKFDVAFLNLKEEEIGHKYYQIAFFGHVYTSIFVLIFGITQFSKYIRNKLTKLHRAFGQLYVFLILFIAAPTGFIMALHANGGAFSRVSFSIQALLWFWFTYKAFRFVKNKEWINHQKFMLRSYALTLSAVSLRLFKWIIVSTIELSPMDTYKIVSWLGWLFNLVIIEIYLINRKNYT